MYVVVVRTQLYRVARVVTSARGDVGTPRFHWKSTHTFFHMPPKAQAMCIMNSFVNDIFERIAAEASRIAHYNRRC